MTLAQISLFAVVFCAGGLLGWFNGKHSGYRQCLLHNIKKLTDCNKICIEVLEQYLYPANSRNNKNEVNAAIDSTRQSVKKLEWEVGVAERQLEVFQQDGIPKSK